MYQTNNHYIDIGTNKYVDIVFGRTYFLVLTGELKKIIQTGQIKIDYNTSDNKTYSPFCDCLYYPTVSTSKCGDQFDANDWRKLEEELVKYSGKDLPTFQIYSLKRLTNELCYFLKIVFCSKLHPQEMPINFGFEYFVNQYWFIYNNFPELNKKDEYKDFWINVLENLKNDNCVTRMGFDGHFWPLGNYVADSLEWLKKQIN
jgi:hypothetical protein